MQEAPLTTLPGTRDLLPVEISGWHLVEKTAAAIFENYGFQEIRTPLFEATELFARGIGGDTDIVGKEMYTFEDQSGRSISLRPEATASVVRAAIQHTMYRGAGLTKIYYIGPMFRYEKKQKGRWRQFYQAGAEVLGSEHPAVEAEVIEMTLFLLDELKVPSRLLINSVGDSKCRPAYVDLLRRHLHENLPGLCQDCRRRSDTNPLRVLDCKVENCQPIIERLPRITDHLCRECAEHFTALREYLDRAGICYEIVPRLVRGLDYYVRTAFEVVSGELGSQNALLGGGRYDGLAEALGGPRIQGFGFAIGLDRLVMVLPEEVASDARYRPDLFLSFIGQAAFNRAVEIARSLRHKGHGCYIEIGGGSLKSQMRLANRMNARHVLIVGEEELSRDRYPLKRMEDSTQWDVSPAELASYLEAHRQ